MSGIWREKERSRQKINSEKDIKRAQKTKFANVLDP